MEFAKARFDSINGTIQSSWRIEGAELKLDVTIPPNTTATIYVPTSDAKLAKESTGESVKLLRAEDGSAVYEVLAGEYSFRAPR